MLLSRDLEIFNHHFPGFPLFPGALLLDYYIRNFISDSEVSNYNYKIQFLQPLLPNDEFYFEKIETNNEININILSKENKIFSIINITRILKLQQVSLNLKDYSSKIRYNEPMANHGEKIRFLDYWYEVENHENVITAVGKYVYKDNALSFLREISETSNFGKIFLLIELMGLTVLSSLASCRAINLEDNYGFTRLNDFKILGDFQSGDLLTAVVKCRRLGSSIIWSGYVLCKEVLIADINQNVNLPLK